MQLCLRMQNDFCFAQFASRLRVARKLKLAKINKKQRPQQQQQETEDYKAKSINLTAKEILL